MENYTQEYNIERNDIANAGTVASLTKRALRKRGLSRDFIKQVTIGVYEAEINVVIHSYGGKVTVNITDDFVEVTFKDVGPGIPSIEQALTKGFSTASSYAIENGFGAGMGLPNIQAVSDEMELTSSEEGTYLHIKFNVNEDCYES
ncbi:Serine/threonine-protein kinase RsbT [Candidatus Izimaplasma bacterium HR1]|uniref:ATP-binding protein n=1 Tax=Candidatus Izimoplasma sp. HR1 TaxID=1541959 RepID=UPI0004F5E489|nr:Serine/threonine-protein kinase RsbT [Candidatus Izimaplasma bacterium HR1]